MNTKQTITAFASTLIFGLALFAGMRIADAAKVWINPSASPTAGNRAIPLHTGAGTQIKSGGLSVNTFLAAKNAQFDQMVFFRKPIHGGTPDAASALHIGGANPAGQSYTVHAIISSVAHADGTFGAAELANASKQTVCGDQDGHIILCSQPSPAPAVPKDLYGSLVEWCDNGNPRVKFTFTNPTPVALHMNLAMCTDTYWSTSKISCWGTDLFKAAGAVYYPWLAPNGTKDSPLSSRAGAFDITVPAGSTTYTTPNLQVNGEAAWCRMSGKLAEGVPTAFYNNNLKYPSPPYAPFLFKMLNNTDYNLHFTGTTMYRTDPKYNNFTPIVVK